MDEKLNQTEAQIDKFTGVEFDEKDIDPLLIRPPDWIKVYLHKLAS